MKDLAHRPETSLVPQRYSRHYYDLYKMTQTPVKEAAMAELGLLADVVEFKKKFYPRGWARYDDAGTGALRLVPPDHVEKVMRSDYAAMGEMIFGEIPAWGAIIAALAELEAEINERVRTARGI